MKQKILGFLGAVLITVGCVGVMGVTTESAWANGSVGWGVRIIAQKIIWDLKFSSGFMISLAKFVAVGISCNQRKMKKH